MATSFNGWGSSWGDSWGPITTGGMRASISFSLSVTAKAKVNTVAADNARYSQAVKDHAHWKQLRDEDDVLLALLQHFVMEEV
jgi:hypothetical protein